MENEEELEMIAYEFLKDGHKLRIGTNNSGEGLFLWGYKPNQPSPEWIQLQGTCDFSTKGIKNPREKIRRFLDKQGIEGEWVFGPYSPKEI